MLQGTESVDTSDALGSNIRVDSRGVEVRAVRAVHAIGAVKLLFALPGPEGS